MTATATTGRSKTPTRATRKPSGESSPAKTPEDGAQKAVAKPAPARRKTTTRTASNTANKATAAKAGTAGQAASGTRAPAAGRSTAQKATSKKTTSTQRSEAAAERIVITPEQRAQMIAEAAYYRAEQRGFAGGDPAGDWLEAELEVDQLLAETPVAMAAEASRTEGP